MALEFPWSRADFMDLLNVQDVKFDLHRPLKSTGLRSGEILTAEASPPMWIGSVSLPVMRV
jgi:hypothetical protein